MAPAQQRFDPDGQPAGQVDFGQVSQLELVVGQRLAQLVFHLHTLDDMGIHFRAEEAERIAPVLLGMVHGHVGVAQQGIDVGAIAGTDADADRHRQADLLRSHLHRPRHRLHHAAGHVGRLVDPANVGQDHDKLVAALAADGIDPAHAAFQAPRHFPEHGVPGLVAKTVVDALEAVQVEEHHRHHAVLAARRLQGLLQAVEKQHPVWQVGQEVVLGQVAGVLFEPLAVGDVGQDGHVVRHQAGLVADRGQGHPDRVFLAALALAPDFALPVVVIGHVIPDLRVKAGVAQVRAQVGQFGADDFVGPEAGDVGKCLVYGQHPVPAVGDGNGVAAVLEHLGRHLQRGFGSLAAGDIAQHRIRQKLVVQRHRGEQHLGPEAAAVGQLIAPFEAAVAFDEGLGRDRGVRHLRRFAGRLAGRGEIEQGLANQCILAAAVKQGQRGGIGIDDVVAFDQHDGVVRALEQVAEVGAGRQQVGLVDLALADVDFHAKYLLRHAVADDGEMGGVHPAVGPVQAAYMPVARRGRLAGLPDRFEGGIELGLALRVHYQAGQRAADGFARRHPEHFGASMVPEADNAVAVGAVDRHRGRELERGHEAVQDVQGFAARTVRFGQHGAGR